MDRDFFWKIQTVKQMLHVDIKYGNEQHMISVFLLAFIDQHRSIHNRGEVDRLSARIILVVHKSRFTYYYHRFKH